MFLYRSWGGSLVIVVVIDVIRCRCSFKLAVESIFLASRLVALILSYDSALTLAPCESSSDATIGDLT